MSLTTCLDPHGGLSLSLSDPSLRAPPCHSLHASWLPPYAPVLSAPQMEMGHEGAGEVAAYTGWCWAAPQSPRSCRRPCCPGPYVGLMGSRALEAYHSQHGSGDPTYGVPVLLGDPPLLCLQLGYEPWCVLTHHRPALLPALGAGQCPPAWPSTVAQGSSPLSSCRTPLRGGFPGSSVRAVDFVSPGSQSTLGAQCVSWEQPRARACRW